MRRVLPALILLVGLTACGGTSAGGAPTVIASPAPSTASSPATSVATPESSGTPSDASSPGTQGGGEQVTDFDHDTEFDNGVAVQVDTIDATRNAPDGKPMVTFTVEIVNKSSDPLTTKNASVHLAYGKDATKVGPVSGAKGLSTFSDTIAVGRTAKATYGFEVPAKEQGQVELSVVLGDGYDTVVFKGSAR